MQFLRKYFRCGWRIQCNFLHDTRVQSNVNERGGKRKIQMQNFQPPCACESKRAFANFKHDLRSRAFSTLNVTLQQERNELSHVLLTYIYKKKKKKRLYVISALCLYAHEKPVGYTYIWKRQAFICEQKHWHSLCRDTSYNTKKKKKKVERYI